MAIRMNRRDFLKVGLTCGVVAGFNSNVIAESLDAAALRSFRPYWYLIRPVSGMIRRRMLRTIAQRCRE